MANRGSAVFDIDELLALKGKEITIVKNLSRIVLSLEALTRDTFLERSAGYGIKVLTEREIIRINDKGVIVTDKKEGTEGIEAHSVIVALGSTSNDKLVKDLRNAPVEVYTIGNAVKLRCILNAISEGSFIGRYN